jgi:hypothetical protein
MEGFGLVKWSVSSFLSMAAAVRTRLSDEEAAEYVQDLEE